MPTKFSTRAVAVLAAVAISGGAFAASSSEARPANKNSTVKVAEKKVTTKQTNLNKALKARDRARAARNSAKVNLTLARAEFKLVNAQRQAALTESRERKAELDRLRKDLDAKRDKVTRSKKKWQSTKKLKHLNAYLKALTARKNAKQKLDKAKTKARAQASAWSNSDQQFWSSRQNAVKSAETKLQQVKKDLNKAKKSVKKVRVSLKNAKKKLKKVRGRFAEQLTVVSANMDFNRRGDAAYNRHLKKLTGTGILAKQEVGRGLNSTRVIGFNKTIRNKTLRSVGKVGAHRGMALGTTTIGGVPVKVASVHGLHVGTVGKKAQNRYYKQMQKWTQLQNKSGNLWIIAGDFNRMHHKVAKKFGGSSAGHRIDGVVVSKGLRVKLKKVDMLPKRRNWSDHPAVAVTVQLG